MARKKTFITVTDQFCGAGGSSQGVRNLAVKNGGGIEVKLALNHWKLAIETHNTNFPNTQHECTDISACDPRRYPSTDILITSPECTNHSLAKGQKIVQKQIELFTSGKLDVYNCIIVENVVDARKWIMFDAWLNAMYVLGYQHKCVYLNSMHCHPTPQSRDRMYIVLWRKGNKTPMLEYTPKANCDACGKDVDAVQTWKQSDKRYGKYKQQYMYCCPVHATVVEPYYYAAFNCINWSDRGNRIGDRKKDLAANSKKRIMAGIEKYGSNPFLMHAAYSDKARGVIRPLNESSFTQTTFTSQAIVQQPFIINDQHSTGIDFRIKGITEQMQGITTQPHFKLIMPFIIKGEHTTLNGYTNPVTDPVLTQTVRQSMSLVIPPFIVENKGMSLSRNITSPLSCATSRPYHGIISTDSWNSFISHYYNGSDCVKHITDAIGTATGNDRAALVSYTKPNYEDCYYRMLKPSEIKLAMAFDNDYVILGTGKEQVKQCGNAVTPPAMEWLVQQCIKSLN